MDRIEVKLLNKPDLYLAVISARTCYSSMDKSDCLGPNDLKLIKNLVKKGHTSVIEHVVYTFKISGISRACLQQLVRHRMASYSVQSTRYTLKKVLKNYENKNYTPDEIIEKTKPFLVQFGNHAVDFHSASQLSTLVYGLKQGQKNDEYKYMLPEAFRTELIWTINARSLRNFFKLRLSKKAHFEIRHLAKLIKKELPPQHLVMFDD